MITDVFCKIIKKELPAKVIMKGRGWMAIKDIHPQAPVHVLIFAKKHITDMASLSDKDSAIAGKLLLAANKVAKKLGIEKNGFRLIINQGKHSGVLVPHFHIHLLGGRHLGAKIIN